MGAPLPDWKLYYLCGQVVNLNFEVRGQIALTGIEIAQMGLQNFDPGFRFYHACGRKQTPYFFGRILSFSTTLNGFSYVTKL